MKKYEKEYEKQNEEVRLNKRFDFEIVFHWNILWTM